MIRLPILAAVLALLVAGCGLGGDDDEAATRRIRRRRGSR